MAVLTKLVALRLECVHYRLNWAEKGVLLLPRKCLLLPVCFKIGVKTETDVEGDCRGSRDVSSAILPVCVRLMWCDSAQQTPESC